MKKLILIATLAAWGFHAAYAQNLPFIGVVSPGKVQNVASGAFTATTRFMLRNTGAVPLQFYMANSATAQASGAGVTVAANSQAEATVAQLGGTLAGQNLNVINNAVNGFGRLGIFTVLKVFPTNPQGLVVGCIPLPQWQSDFTNNYLFNCTSNIGIGTNLPAAQLHVVGTTRIDGNMQFNGMTNISDQLFVGTSLTGPLYGSLFVNGPGRFGTDQNNIYIGTAADGSTNTSIESTGGNGLLINYYNGVQIGMFGNVHIAARPNSTVAPDLVVDGAVAIGTAAIQSGYKLSVKGDIRCNHVHVDTGWGDYVFDNNYKLRSLKELEAYIKANHHLPEIPAASEVETKGADLGEMVKLQMVKIEELSMYVIQQQKEIEGLKHELHSKAEKN